MSGPGNGIAAGTAERRGPEGLASVPDRPHPPAPAEPPADLPRRQPLPPPRADGPVRGSGGCRDAVPFRAPGRPLSRTNGKRTKCPLDPAAPAVATGRPATTAFRKPVFLNADSCRRYRKALNPVFARLMHPPVVRSLRIGAHERVVHGFVALVDLPTGFALVVVPDLAAVSRHDDE